MQRKIHFINDNLILPNYIKGLPKPNPNLKQYAKDNRKAGHLPEVAFWMQVHKGKFHGIDFHRQIVMGHYIVDFYVKYLGLVIEIDGSSHDGREVYDAKRTQYLESFGMKVYRILNDEILNDMEGVLARLEKYVVREFGNGGG
jgi:very-short-patch-repair endonuclease